MRILNYNFTDAALVDCAEAHPSAPAHLGSIIELSSSDDDVTELSSLDEDPKNNTDDDKNTNK